MAWGDFPGGSVPGLTGGDPRVRVAVLDGPVDRGHPCFDGASLEVLQTLAGEAGGPEALAHGTHVASILFGRATGGVRGIAPSCTGLIVPIFGMTESGLPTCSQLDLARAILLALDNGAQIINISSGQPSPSSEPDPLLAQAINRCVAANVLIVAAAGNDGCDCLHVPAAAGSVLAVGAMDDAGQPLSSSNWGDAYQSQGLLAPGHGIVGAKPGGGTIRRSGTSYATPYIAGIAALLVGLQIAAGLAPDPQAVRRALLASADPCPAAVPDACRRFLSGTINVERAVAMLAQTFTKTSIGGDIMIADREWKQVMPAGITDIPVMATGEINPPTEGLRLSGEIEAGIQSLETPGAIAPSDCGCGCGGAKKNAEDGKSGDCGCGCGGAKKRPQLVYALGKLGIDFGSEARRDSILQAMSMMPGEAQTAGDVMARLLDYFDAAPYDAPSVIWTLNLDATPIYAIQPVGAFAASAYERLREALKAQLSEGADLVSVPGMIAGSVRLQSGQQVPVIMPAMRGIYSWATRPLVEHVLGVMPESRAEAETYQRVASGLTNYLDRVYYDLRNLGLTGEERALNYSATNAVQIASVLRSATTDALDLDRIAVRKSPVCRPDSDCYDVELSFFNPNNTNIANRVFRFTVDVSDIIPVTVGQERSWTRRV